MEISLSFVEKLHKKFNQIFQIKQNRKGSDFQGGALITYIVVNVVFCIKNRIQKTLPKLSIQHPSNFLNIQRFHELQKNNEIQLTKYIQKSSKILDQFPPQVISYLETKNHFQNGQ